MGIERRLKQSLRICNRLLPTLRGGDLADAGASPVEIVDRIRDLGWQGVVGNTDEMLFRPESRWRSFEVNRQRRAALPQDGDPSSRGCRKCCS
jgi:hypothetical protein